MTAGHKPTKPALITLYFSQSLKQVGLRRLSSYFVKSPWQVVESWADRLFKMSAFIS